MCRLGVSDCGNLTGEGARLVTFGIDVHHTHSATLFYQSWGSVHLGDHGLYLSELNTGGDMPVFLALESIFVVIPRY